LNVLLPAATFTVSGDVQSANEDEPSAHLKMPASSDENENDALVDPVVDGGVEVSETVGAVVSTAHVYGVAFPGFPRTSVANTEKVWLPSVSPL
jgi:hypothetical protein